MVLLYVDEFFETKDDAFAYLKDLGLVDLVDTARGSIVLVTPSVPYGQDSSGNRTGGFSDADQKNYYKLQTAMNQMKARVDQLSDAMQEIKGVLSALLPDDTEAQLQQTQAALSAVTLERDELQNTLINATNDLAVAESAAVVSASAAVLDADGNIVLEAEDVNALNLDNLPAGAYTISIISRNAAGDAVAQYSFPCTVR